MEISRSYTVVPPNLTNETKDTDISDERAFYLMIKIYGDGVLTPVINKIQEGEYTYKYSILYDLLFAANRLARFLK